MKMLDASTTSASASAYERKIVLRAGTYVMGISTLYERIAALTDAGRIGKTGDGYQLAGG